MRKPAQILSWLACSFMIILPVLYCAQMIEIEPMKQVMLIATLVWFSITPFWMGRNIAG